MEVFNNLSSLGQNQNPSSVALGFFDGVHCAHRQLLSRAVSSKYSPIVFTFFGGKTDSGNILSREQKLAEFEQLGIKQVIMPNFEELRLIPYEFFFSKYLIGCLNAKKIFCGYDYKFGKDALGDTNSLLTLCEKEKITLDVLPKLSKNGDVVSSTRIRNMIKNGEIEMANLLLSYEFYTQGVVIKGRELGRTLGVPTINQCLCAEQIAPKFGVYSTTAWVNNIPYKSITNIGKRLEVPVAETYLFDFDGDLYGQTVKISYHRFLRDEMKFTSLDELKTTIQNDVSGR